MKRREVLALLSGMPLAWVGNTGGHAADRSNPPRIGFISALNESAASDFLIEFRDQLAVYGYPEPKLDLLFANYASERIPGFVEELERRRVDVIVTHGGATRAVVKAPRTRPVIYQFSADPVSLGVATDLAHPLFNATGITLMLAENNSKRLEILREIVPECRRIAVVANPLHPGEHLERADTEGKARQLGMEISFYPTPNRGELDRTLAAIDAERPDAMFLFSDAFIVENRQHILNFAMSRHIPVITGWAIMAESGAVCSYGPRLSQAFRRVAYFVHRVLQGAKPAELPIEQPTILELVVNLNSAKTLGLTIPPTILARADKVIE